MDEKVILLAEQAADLVAEDRFLIKYKYCKAGQKPCLFFALKCVHFGKKIFL